MTSERAASPDPGAHVGGARVATAWDCGGAGVGARTDGRRRVPSDPTIAES